MGGAQRQVKAGETYAYGFATMTFPVDCEINDADGIVRRKRYLDDPAGLKVTGARRLNSPGVLDYQAKAHRIELEVPRPDWKTLMTLIQELQALD